MSSLTRFMFTNTLSSFVPSQVKKRSCNVPCNVCVCVPCLPLSICVSVYNVIMLVRLIHEKWYHYGLHHCFFGLQSLHFLDILHQNINPDI